MNVIDVKISDLKPYENNPRKNDEAVPYVMNSIRNFGFKVPVIIDKDNVVVAGHTRIKAAKKLGMKSVPCIIADDLTEEQIRAFRLADNKTAEFAEWDEEKLSEELKQILDLDMEDFGFKELEEELGGAEDDKYTKNINLPQYTPKGEEYTLEELVNKQRYSELVEEIDESEVPEEIKEFLRLAATRHLAFNYQKIAEYYASADKDVQELFERSALVIIDFDDAIKNGYVQLSSEMEDIMESENE